MGVGGAAPVRRRLPKKCEKLSVTNIAALRSEDNGVVLN